MYSCIFLYKIYVLLLVCINKGGNNMENLQMLTEEELMEIEGGGWWNSWGKCVAGTIGGAGTGGLGGAAAGSAVPVIGTGIGGAIGGVSGGLTGAATFC
ncbi:MULTISPECIES: Blp family class II bacteriocin [Bacillus]|jgi:lactobin A/cerein 7B family class IIb bacteriocin|uniref:Blp family class II bacteriocin n=1 Tax=Bacillus TaxID=1386 RepID=UPI0028973ED9|nr:Blp family class II bacteriocin [Bacillus cereus]